MSQVTALLKNRVEHGAEMLDTEVPGWFNRIDTGTLELENCVLCVLGQLFGEYYEGVKALGIRNQGSFFGFSLSFGDEGYYGPDDWELLRTLWIEEIRKRQA